MPYLTNDDQPIEGFPNRNAIIEYLNEYHKGQYWSIGTSELDVERTDKEFWQEVLTVIRHCDLTDTKLKNIDSNISQELITTKLH